MGRLGRRSPATAAAGLALWCWAWPLHAQETEVERALAQISELPNVVIAELLTALREARGAGVELSGAGYQYAAPATLERPGPDGDRRLASHTFHARVLVPVPVSRRTAVAAAFAYETVTFDVAGELPGIPRAPLFGLRSRIALLHQLGPRWSFKSAVEVALMSDLGPGIDRAPTIDDLQTGAVALFDAKLAPFATLSFGGLISSQLPLPIPIPAVRLSLEHEGLSAELTVPTNLTLGYAPHERATIGLRGAISGNSFHLMARGDTLSQNGVSVGPFVAVEPLRGFTVELGGGVAPWRQLRLTSADETRVQKLDPRTAATVSVDLGFRL